MDSQPEDEQKVKRRRTSADINETLIKEVQRALVDVDATQTDAIEHGLRMWLDALHSGDHITAKYTVTGKPDSGTVYVTDLREILSEIAARLGRLESRISEIMNIYSGAKANPNDESRASLPVTPGQDPSPIIDESARRFESAQRRRERVEEPARRGRAGDTKTGSGA